MKKVITLLIFNTLLSFNLAAALFSGYDFTFFSSVAESIAISDSERIGFDYTGYGYFGDMTTGLFLRLGIQAPYSTLLYTLDDLVGNTGDSHSDSFGDSGQGLFDENQLYRGLREYKFLVAIGPAFRKIVSPDLSWYMGVGLKAEIDWLTYITDASLRDTMLSYLVSTDIDFGFRITADVHTTLRIGAYVTRPLFELFQSFTTRDGERGESEFSFIQNIYPDMNSHDSTTNVVGYISLGHTYASYIREEKYRYIISSSVPRTGEIELMEG